MLHVGVLLYRGVHLLILKKYLGDTFIPGVTFIMVSRVLCNEYKFPTLIERKTQILPPRWVQFDQRQLDFYVPYTLP